MKTPDEIMKENGLMVDWLKDYEPDTYNAIRKAMDAFAEQYAEWRLSKSSDPDKSELIAFAVAITGHDEDTIRQIYNDWKK